MWQYAGQKRPDFAAIPGPGQESVWDYPRPPALVADDRLVEVYNTDELIVSTSSTYRVLETAHPPSFYIPPKDVKWSLLESAPDSSVCEWKGTARYWALAIDPNHYVVGWSYPDPTPSFEAIRDYVSFYPAVLACFVAGERVRPQSGNFYGGWVTGEITGPIKGEPGSAHW